MCGRFYMWEYEFQKLLENYDLIQSIVDRLDFDHDFHPGQEAVLLRKDGDRTVLDCKRWGYPGFESGRFIFNARIETVFEKTMFRKGILGKRCIIPATGFYEWNAYQEKYTFDREDGSMLYMAGIYDHFGGEDRFVILTRKADRVMAPIHNRMPVILQEHQIHDWLFKEEKTGQILNETGPMLKSRIDRKQLSLF